MKLPEDCTVLLVEEGQTNRNLVENFLKSEGYRLLNAPSCDDALQILEGESIDLMLLDLGIDESECFNLCHHIRNTDHISQLPIIMLTSVEDREKHHTAYEAGIDDFIEKPITRDVLRSRVRTITRLNHYRTLHETTELMRQQASELDRLRNFDPVTGLANLETFKSSLDHALRRAERSDYTVAVLAVTANEFDQVRGVYGEDMANSLAQEISQRLTGTSKAHAVVGRVDGSSYIIYQPIPGHEDLVPAVQRVRHRFHSPYLINNEEFNITSSVGASVYSADAADVDTLVSMALSAMVRASKQGRNRYQVYAKSTQSAVKRQLRLESQIRRALDADSLRLHYQPRFDLNNGRVSAIEGLMRMTDEHGTQIAPNVFLPVAQDSGLIYEMGRRAVQQACMDVAHLVDNGHPHMKVSVNLTSNELRHPEFVDELEKSLAAAKITGAHLEFEISESSLAPDENNDLMTISRRLHAIRRLGVGTLIDNFGKGYSSLHFMRHLPVDGIKIDSSFVRDACSDPRAAAIIQGILAFGEIVGVRVIGEGVETEQQLHFLRNSGCCAVQGFIFSKARPFVEIPETLERLARDWNDPFTSTDVGPAEVKSKANDTMSIYNADIKRMLEH